MNDIEVTELISRELGGRVTNKHGWEFKQLLVQPPERAVFASPDDEARPLWIVLREQHDGYVIAYDESDARYYLVCGGTVISGHASFMEAINGL